MFSAENNFRENCLFSGVIAFLKMLQKTFLGVWLNLKMHLKTQPNQYQFDPTGPNATLTAIISNPTLIHNLATNSPKARKTRGKKKRKETTNPDIFHKKEKGKKKKKKKSRRQ
jgi:hypothetical protein